MSFGRYVVGIALLAVAVVPVAVAARVWRRRVLARWSGESALLAEVVLVLGAVTVVAEVLGAAHALKAVPLAFACGAAGTAALVAASRGTRPASTAAASGARGTRRRPQV